MVSSETELSERRPESSSVILETDGLIRRFGSFTAVDDVELSIPRGEFHSIIGPNGAGKTTLFNLITGALEPTEGKIWFDGADITDKSESIRAKRGIIRAFQITQLFPELSVHENIRLAAQSTQQDLNPLKRTNETCAQRATDILTDLGLDTDPETPAKTLAHGDKKKLEIGMAIVTDPDLLLLDEPTSGVSSGETDSIMEFIQSTATDITVLLIEHNIDLVLEASDRVTVLHQGAVLEQGTPSEITDSKEVQQAYLGGA